MFSDGTSSPSTSASSHIAHSFRCSPLIPHIWYTLHQSSPVLVLSLISSRDLFAIFLFQILIILLCLCLSQLVFITLQQGLRPSSQLPSFLFLLLFLLRLLLFILPLLILPLHLCLNLLISKTKCLTALITVVTSCDDHVHTEPTDIHVTRQSPHWVVAINDELNALVVNNT